MINGIALAVTGKSALRTNPNLLQGLLDGSAVTLRNELGRVEHPLLHLLLVLQLGELAGHHSQDHVLVLGQFLERLEASGTGGVVLEVVGVNVELLEQLGGDVVIATLGEVTATNEVTTADVDADVEVGGALGEGIVVQLDVLVEQLQGSLLVQGVFFPALKHLLGAEVYHPVS